MPRPLHPVPAITNRSRYDHIPYTYKKADVHFEAVTASGSIEAGLVRLVSNYRPSIRAFSRGPDSWVSLDTYSIGIAHFWAETAPGLLQCIARQRPDLARYAWGDEGVGIILEDDRLVRHTGTKRGGIRHNPELDWLVAGWYEICRHPDVLAAQFGYWMNKYVPKALRYFNDHGWKNKATLAGLVRVNNSGGMRSKFNKGIELEGDDEIRVLRRVFKDPDIYDHPERLESLLTWPEFEGDVPDDWTPRSNAFDFSVPVIRVDGTRPRFMDRDAKPSDDGVIIMDEEIIVARPVLRKGSDGDWVRELQSLLSASGSDLTIDGDFGPGTEKEVRYFQETHLGKDGRFLLADGVVGLSTWWSLDNQEGDAQKSNIKALIPEGVSNQRAAFLEIPIHEWRIGIKEEPGGSNWSTEPEGGIAKYVDYDMDGDADNRPGAWCMRFSKYCYRVAAERGILNEHQAELLKMLGNSGSCSKTRRRAQEMNDDGHMVWYDNDGSYTPIPGDMGIMDGHVVLVLRVSDGSTEYGINTVEGNSGNRVKCGYRDGDVMIGYVNLFGDADSCDYSFEFGTIDAEDTGRHSTR